MAITYTAIPGLQYNGNPVFYETGSVVVQPVVVPVTAKTASFHSPLPLSTVAVPNAPTKVNPNLIPTVDLTNADYIYFGATVAATTAYADPIVGKTFPAYNITFPAARSGNFMNMTLTVGTQYTVSVLAKGTAPFSFNWWDGVSPNDGTDLTSAVFAPSASLFTRYSYTFSPPNAGVGGTLPSIGIVCNNVSGTASGTTTFTEFKIETGKLFTGYVAPPVTAAALNATATTATASAIAINTGNPSLAVMSCAVATNPTHGTASVSSSTTINYTSAAGYVGNDSFAYTATTADGTSAPATISITVSGVPTSGRHFFTGAYSWLTNRTVQQAGIAEVLGQNADMLLSYSDHNAGNGSELEVDNVAAAPAVYTLTIYNIWDGSSSTDGNNAANGSFNSYYQSGIQTIAANWGSRLLSLRIDQECNIPGSSWGWNGGGSPFTGTTFGQAFARLAGFIRTSLPSCPIVYNLNQGWPIGDPAYPGDSWVDVVSLDMYDNIGTVFSNGGLWNYWLTNGGGSLGWISNFATPGYSGGGLINGPRSKQLMTSVDEWGVGQGSGDAEGARAIASFAAWMAGQPHFIYHSYWNSDTSDSGFSGALYQYPLSQAAFKTAFATPYIGTWTKMTPGTINSSLG